jgi:hemerythrin-like domain-containing protein
MLTPEMRQGVSKTMRRDEDNVPTTEPIALLMSQHREVEDLFSKIESAGDKAFTSKKKLFATLAEKLTLHMKLEESIFYPAAMKVDDDAVVEAREEHANVKTMIRKIAAIEPSDETFTAKVKVLKELVEHHVEEEESTLFPECKKSFEEEDLDMLGEKLAAMVAKNLGN